MVQPDGSVVAQGATGATANAGAADNEELAKWTQDFNDWATGKKQERPGKHPDPNSLWNVDPDAFVASLKKRRDQFDGEKEPY